MSKLQEMLDALANEMYSDSKSWFGDAADDLSNITLGICGESGEFADVVKKLGRGSLTTQQAVPLLRVELCDVFIYTLLAMRALRSDMVSEYERKRAFNQNRFGQDEPTDQGDVASD